MKHPVPPFAASLLLAGCLGFFSPAGAESVPPGDTATIMRDVFDAIAYLLPLSVRDQQVSTTWDKELIDEKLTVLRRASAALSAHAAARPPAFGFLARSFDDAVREIDGSFREEWPSYAYFSLMELTQHCVACHTQQPGGPRDTFSERLLARIDTSVLDDSELAQLYVATRQFDAALKVFERKLLAADQDAVDLDFAGILLDYLSIALGVAEDPTRADHLLQQFARRPDVPYYLATRLAHWRTRLAALRPSLQAAAGIDEARALFATGSRAFIGARDRQAAIDDLVATSMLRRFIAAQPAPTGADVAEAYYMLGVIALRTLEPKYSVPEMEILFASAIRAAPRGPFAEPAYRLLEEFGYVRDVHLARKDASNTLVDMAALKQLVQAAK